MKKLLIAVAVLASLTACSKSDQAAKPGSTPSSAPSLVGSWIADYSKADPSQTPRPRVYDGGITIYRSGGAGVTIYSGTMKGEVPFTWDVSGDSVTVKVPAAKLESGQEFPSTTSKTRVIGISQERAEFGTEGPSVIRLLRVGVMGGSTPLHGTFRAGKSSLTFFQDGRGHDGSPDDQGDPFAWSINGNVMKFYGIKKTDVETWTVDFRSEVTIELSRPDGQKLSLAK